MIRPHQPAKTNNLVAHRKILRETPWLVFGGALLFIRERGKGLFKDGTEFVLQRIEKWVKDASWAS